MYFYVIDRLMSQISLRRRVGWAAADRVKQRLLFGALKSHGLIFKIH
jgi:hypothetical protein